MNTDYNGLKLKISNKKWGSSKTSSKLGKKPTTSKGFLGERESHIMVNTFLLRSERQGHPFSPLLFSVALEFLDSVTKEKKK